MDIDKNVRVKLDLDLVKATVLMDMINTTMDELGKVSSLDSMIKYVVLQEIGKEMINQIIPEIKQEELIQSLQQKNDTILQAWKKEREGK